MKLILVALLIGAVWQAGAQVTFEKRIELELKDGFDGEDLIELGQDGFLLRTSSSYATDGMTEWKYDLYNIDLNPEASKSLFIDKKFYADETWVGEERVHTLFRTRKGMYILYSLQPGTLVETKIEGEFPRKTRVSDMAVIGDYAYFIAGVKRSNFLFSINWKTGEQKIIPIEIDGYSNKKISLTNFQVLENTNEVFLFVKARDKKEYNTFIFRLDNNGNKQDTYKLTRDVDKNFVSISATSLGNGKYTFTGTYAATGSTKSEGIFFCAATEGEIDFVKFYKFTDLTNFFKYLPERKQERLKRKRERKKARGKDLNYTYHIAEHPIIQVEDGYMFLGEAYYPTYRTETYTTYVNGRPTTTTRSVFDGYQYTHAVLARFNDQGEMLWDQIFEMWPSYKPFHVKRFISIADGKQDGVYLAFANHNRITSTAFSFDGEEKFSRTSDPIETNFEGDRSKWTFSNLNYWYGNYFIAYGTQKIKNKEDKDVKRKRWVYFISKIRYE